MTSCVDVDVNYLRSFARHDISLDIFVSGGQYDVPADVQAAMEMPEHPLYHLFFFSCSEHFEYIKLDINTVAQSKLNDTLILSEKK